MPAHSSEVTLQWSWQKGKILERFLWSFMTEEIFTAEEELTQDSTALFCQVLAWKTLLA